MKVSNKSKKLAKRIFKNSQKQGEIDEQKLSNFTQVLIKHHSVQSKQVLKSLLALLEESVAASNLIVESATLLDEPLKNEIKNTFEKKLNKKINLVFKLNPEIIGGVKIVNSDNVWENSVESALAQMKASL